MKIDDVTTQGFRSIQDKMKWVLPEGAGFYFITGDNKVDPQLGANAVGKSSLLEAITWCFYGKTSRGLRGGDVASWNGKGKVNVSVNFTRRGVKRNITRMVKPNRLLLDGAVVQQEEVNNALGINFECFLFSAMIGQFNKYFLDLGATDKLNLFSFVLNLNYWADKSNNAKDDYNESELLVNSLRQDYAELGGRKEEITDQIAALEVDIKNYDRERKQQLKELNKKLDEYYDAKDRQSLLLTTQQQNYNVHKAKGKSLAKGIEKAQAAVDIALDVLSRRRSSTSVAKDRYNAILENMKLVESAAPFCPNCRQSVSKKHVREELERLREKTKKARLRRKEVEDAEREAQDEANSSREGLRLLQGKMHKYEIEQQDEDEDLRNIKNQLKIIKEDIADTKQDIKNLSREDNPHQKQYDRLLDTQQKLTIEVSAIKKKLRAAKVKSANKKFWIKEFRAIQLQLIEESLAELELESGNALAALGLPGWALSFSVYRETKAGTLQRGLVASVIPPGSEKPIKLECYAGGETQRLRIAGSIGIMNLIARRRGVDLKFVFIDEPTVHLHTKGVEDLLSFLRDYAQLEDKSVFLVDHRSLDAGVFDACYKIIKDEDGSRLEVNAV